MSRIIDIHSHVLPDVDDGSRSVEQSIAMLQMAAQQGIEHVVATPHFYPQHDTPERFLARRHEAECQLREAMEKHEGLPRLSVGAEIYFFSGISELDVLNELTIDANKCIILEMPQAPWSEKMYREIGNIQPRQGITPIIAHVDRYISPLRTYQIPERLMELPVLVQANASFFLDRFRSGMAMRMLRHDQIHLLGSDCHNLDTRAPRLGKAVKAIQQHLGEGALERIREYQDLVFAADAG